MRLCTGSHRCQSLCAALRPASCISQSGCQAPPRFGLHANSARALCSVSDLTASALLTSSRPLLSPQPFTLSLLSAMLFTVH